MQYAIQKKLELAQFLSDTLDFYSREWLEYLRNHKSYLISFLKEHDGLENFDQYTNPLMKIIAENIVNPNTEDILYQAKEKGIKSAKTECPIHMAWELFQSSRGFIWNAIKAYYVETKSTIEIEGFFEMERNVNDIIDLFIESYTAHYVSYKDDLLRSHRDTVDELSVPIIPLAEKVCILPVVGNIDTYRAKKLREKTLMRVSELKAQQLVIDISGVPYVDTAVVNHLFKIVRGIKLLGCSTIITGISPGNC